MLLTTAQLNYFNIALMACSAAAAFAFPFELFLLSYAVLGPLHYLTEISWLHDRKYFTESKDRKRTKAGRGWLILVALTLVILITSFVAVEGAGLQANPKWEITFFYLVFASALIITIIEKRAVRYVALAVSLLLLALFQRSRYYVLFAFFLVTIIHVFVFTGLFILYGALKGKSWSGILSLVVFVACAISFFVYVPAGHAAGNFVHQSYRSFNSLNSELIKLFRLGPGNTSSEVYESRSGIMVMRLIAFAYTYHYLNWFSKTSIIKWHLIPRSRTVVMIAVWFGALALYAYDYDTGMAVLYFMSILHVMLEFPLNHRTFAEIGKELYAVAA
jgi:hypothetical protein